MRISDWSSDLRSSDLAANGESPNARSPDRARGQVQYQCPSDASRKDVEPDRNGRDYRNEGNGDGPTLVGLQLITRAGVEQEMAQVRTKMRKKRHRDRRRAEEGKRGTIREKLGGRG